jgi:hypothetical protein
MTDFRVVNMPHYRHLFAIDHLIGRARVIWIDFKSNAFQIGSPLFIKPNG